jgi:TetR/AcrR family transcriptional repressor of nem operon
MPDLPTIEPLPATSKGRATRGRIIDAAADLIYERGVAAVSLDDVRETTGTSKSQLYHYFANKTDLVSAVIERQRERVLAFHAPLLESVSTWDDVQRWRDAIVAVQAERECRSGCPLGSLASELSELDDAARNQLANAFASWRELLIEGLSGLVRSGALRPDADPASLGLSTLASLQGGLLLAEIDRDTRPLEIGLDAAITHLKSLAP